MRNILVFMLSIIGAYLSAQNYVLPRLNANSTWDGVAWQDGLGAVWGAAPPPGAIVRIDRDSLNGFTLTLRAVVTNQCKSLILTDGGTYTGGGVSRIVFQTGAALNLVGHSLSPGPSQLLAVSTIELGQLPNQGRFVLTNPFGVQLLSQGAHINAGLEVNTQDTAAVVELLDDLDLSNNRLVLNSGQFRTNAHDFRASSIWLLAQAGNTSLQRVLSIAGSRVWLSGSNDVPFNHTGTAALRADLVWGQGSELHIWRPSNNAAQVSGQLGGFGANYHLGKVWLHPLSATHNSSDFNLSNFSQINLQIDSLVLVNASSLSVGQSTNSRFLIGHLDISQASSFVYASRNVSTLAGLRNEMHQITGASLCQTPQALSRNATFGLGRFFIPNPLSLDNATVSNWLVDGSVLSIIGGFDAGGNSPNVQILPTAVSDLYWRGGVPADPRAWAQLGNWCEDPALSIVATCVPNAYTNVWFVDGAVESTVQMPAAASCRDMRWINTSTMQFQNTGVLDELLVAGSLEWSAAMTNNYRGRIQFVGTASHSIRSNGIGFGNDIILNTTSGVYELLDDIDLLGINLNNYFRNCFYFQSGTFRTNGHALRMQAWRTEVGSGLRVLNIENSEITIIVSPNQGDYYAAYHRPTTVTANQQTTWRIYALDNPVLPDRGALFFSQAQAFWGNIEGMNSSDLHLRGQMSLGRVSHRGRLAIDVVNSLSIAVLCPPQNEETIFMAQGSYTLRVDSLYTPLTCGQGYFLRGNPYSSNGSVLLTSPLGLSASNTIIEDLRISTASVLHSGLLVGQTNNWTVLSPPLITDFYWTGEGQNSSWWNPDNWKPHSPPNPGVNDDLGFNVGGCLPGMFTNVFFHANSFPGAPAAWLVSIDSTTAKAACHHMNWLGGYSGAPQLRGGLGTNLYLFGSLSFEPTMSLAGDFDVSFLASSSGQTIRSATQVFRRTVEFRGQGAWALQDDFQTQALATNLNYRVEFYRGHLNLNQHRLRTGHFRSVYAGNRSLDAQAARIELVGGAQYPTPFFWTFSSNWAVDGHNLAFNSTGLEVYVEGPNPSFHHYNQTASYQRLVLRGTQASSVGRLGATDGLHFGTLRIEANQSYVYSSLSVDTLVYQQGSSNLIEGGKTIDINAYLDANGNPCTQTVIQSSNTTAARLCAPVGLVLQAAFLDLNRIRSGDCSGFSVNHQISVNGNNIAGTSTGWDFGSALSTLPMLGANRTLSCAQFPDSLDINGFFGRSTTTYLWSDGTSAQHFRVNNPGIYHVTAEYAPGCIRRDSVVIQLNDNLTSSFVLTPPSCPGQADGQVSLLVSGVSAQTRYTWDLSAAGLGVYLDTSALSFAALPSGIYTLTITDPNCPRQLTVNLNDAPGPAPLVLPAGEQVQASIVCTDYLYPWNTNYKILEIKPNGNAFSHALSQVQVSNDFALPLPSGMLSVSPATTGYYELSDAVHTFRLSRRMFSIQASGSYTINGGVLVRVYFNDEDTSFIRTDWSPNGAMLDWGWYKSSLHNPSDILQDLRPDNLPSMTQRLVPQSYGFEAGLRFAEFLVQDFSTIGFFARTSTTILDLKPEVWQASCEEGQAHLSWVLDESTPGLSLEKSFDGYHWTTVRANLANRGKVIESHQDAQPIYYRLCFQEGSTLRDCLPIRTLSCAADLGIDWRIYPNPFHTEFNVSLGAWYNLNQARISLWDALGREVWGQNLSGEASSLSLNPGLNLPPGLYLCRLELFGQEPMQRLIQKL